MTIQCSVTVLSIKTNQIMKLTKSLVVFLVSIARICTAGIVVQTTQPIKSSEPIDAAVNILTSCYGEHGALGAVGHLPRTLLSKLWLKKPIPVIILDLTNQIWDYNNLVPRPVKPQVYLFIVSKGWQVDQVALTTWDKRGADIFVPVLVLTLLPNNKNGCEESPYILAALLRRGFLNVNVLCVITGKEIALCGGNLFTNRAPYPWQFIHYYEHSTINYFMFWRPYRTDNEMCLNLDYEKTKNLSGKKIDLFDMKRSSYPTYRTGYNGTFVSRFVLTLDITVNIWETLLHQMNATSKVRYVIFRKYEVLRAGVHTAAIMVPSPLHFVDEISIPGLEQSDIILMRSRGNKSQLKKILGVVDIYTGYCVFVTLVITLIFFKYVANQRFIPAMLNIFRVICNTGFENLPDNLTSRTFLACLFLSVVTIHGIFSGNLASLLTTEIPVRLPQTVQELLDLEYMIFMDLLYWVLYRDEKYKGHILPAPENCIAVALALINGSCIENKYHILDYAIQGNLSVSSKDLFVVQMGLRTLRRWPFVKTVSTILLRMSSGHIVESLPGRVMMERLDENYAYVISQTEPPRVMRLNDLGFAFIILGIGLVCATISFIIETSINPIRWKINKVRRYFRR